mmetsp:Transcript_445/g.815  ORF Transcript_445/g.815 Transcript_445/m.815 type:complete len:484 (+) Transcript_445:42-1493(+)
MAYPNSTEQPETNDNPLALDITGFIGELSVNNMVNKPKKFRNVYYKGFKYTREGTLDRMFDWDSIQTSSELFSNIYTGCYKIQSTDMLKSINLHVQDIKGQDDSFDMVVEGKESNRFLGSIGTQVDGQVPSINADVTVRNITGRFDQASFKFSLGYDMIQNGYKVVSNIFNGRSDENSNIKSLINDKEKPMELGVGYSIPFVLYSDRIGANFTIGRTRLMNFPGMKMAHSTLNFIYAKGNHNFSAGFTSRKLSDFIQLTPKTKVPVTNERLRSDKLYMKYGYTKKRHSWESGNMQPQKGYAYGIQTSVALPFFGSDESHASIELNGSFIHPIVKDYFYAHVHAHAGYVHQFGVEQVRPFVADRMTEFVPGFTFTGPITKHDEGVQALGGTWAAQATIRGIWTLDWITSALSSIRGHCLISACSVGDHVSSTFNGPQQVSSAVGGMLPLGENGFIEVYYTKPLLVDDAEKCADHRVGVRFQFGW